MRPLVATTFIDAGPRDVWKWCMKMCIRCCHENETRLGATCAFNKSEKQIDSDGDRAEY